MTSVEGGAGGADQGEEFGEEFEIWVSAAGGDDEVGVDLLEGFETGAGMEERLVDWCVR